MQKFLFGGYRKFGIASLLAVLVVAQAQAALPVVHLEKSISPGGGWQDVRAGNLIVTPDGGLMDTDSAQAFYRLRVQSIADIGYPTLGLGEAPPAAVAMAVEHLKGCLEDAWAGAELGPVVYPVYDPSVGGGTQPAYLEFKVVPSRSQVVLSNTPFNSPPLEPKMELGFILVSLTRQDMPIPEFSTDGPTRVEKLRALAKTSQVKAVRYGSGILVAENAKGEAVANLGATPFKLPVEIIDFSTNNTEGVVVGGQVIVAPEVPNITGQDYASYEQFKTNYLNGHLYSKLRGFLGLAAHTAWLLRDGVLPGLLQIDLQNPTNLLSSKTIDRFDVENPSVVVLRLAKAGLDAIGLQVGGTILHVLYAGGGGDTFMVRVGNPVAPLGWGGWSTYYAGAWTDQKLYYQEYALAGCCTSGYSGCGATAWTMLYGYWDGKGISSLIGGGVTPMYNDSYVKTCIQYIFPRVGTFCVGTSGATDPWNMHNGYQWATHQGAGISSSTSWGVPYLGSGPRNKAIQAIRDYGRPAIVGTGYYAHYPFAYGYKYRSYTSWGITWDTQRYWKVNNGQGDTSPIWVDADSCWFGANSYCY